MVTISVLGSGTDFTAPATQAVAACFVADGSGAGILAAAIDTLHRQGQSIMLVEQDAEITLSRCDYAYVMKRGVAVAAGGAASLRANP